MHSAVAGPHHGCDKYTTRKPCFGRFCGFGGLPELGVSEQLSEEVIPELRP